MLPAPHLSPQLVSDSSDLAAPGSRRIYTWATDSNATDDDIPGPGRLMGQLLARGGKRLEALLTSLSLRAGRGPTKPMRIVLEALRCSHCAMPYFGVGSGLPSSLSPVDLVVKDVAVHSTSCASCGMNGSIDGVFGKRAYKACVALVNMIGTGKSTSEYIAILYITVLSVVMPEIRHIFLQRDVDKILRVLRNRILLRPTSDLDALLAASRRALDVVEDRGIHALGKAIVAQWIAMRSLSQGNAYSKLALRKIEMQMQLLPYFSHPSYQAIACAILIRTGIGSALDTLWMGGKTLPNVANFWRWYTRLNDKLRQLPLRMIVRHLSSSQDIVVRSMLTALLTSLRRALLRLMDITAQVEYRDECLYATRHVRDILGSMDWESEMLRDFACNDLARSSHLHYSTGRDLKPTESDALDLADSTDSRQESHSRTRALASEVSYDIPVDHNTPFSPDMNGAEEECLNPNASVRSGSIFALVIGINIYWDLDMTLSGAVSDAEAVQQYLAEDLKVPMGNICMLLNGVATRHNIIDQMRQHLTYNREIHPGDPILIYFTGQGTPNNIQNKGNGGGMIPCDYGSVALDGTVQKSLDVATMLGLLSELAATKGDNITVVVDCCHAGQFHVGKASTHILLAACSPDESAHEEEDQGIFTRALLRALRSSDLPRLSYTRLMTDRVQLEQQTPQCEGANKDRIIFNGKALGINSQLVRVRRHGPHGLRVEAGEMHGVVPGTEFAVRSHNLHSADYLQLGHVVASDIHAVWSVVRPKHEGGIIPSNTYASILHWGSVEKPYIVAFTPQNSANARLKVVMEKFERIARGDPCDVDVRIIRDDASDKANIFVRVDDDGHMVLERRHPLIIKHCPAEWTWKGKGGRGCHWQEWDVFKAAAVFDFHLSRENPRHPLRGSVQIEIDILDKQLRPSTIVPIQSGVVNIKHNPRNSYTVVLHNNSDFDLWFSLYYMDPEEYSIMEICAPAPSMTCPPLRRRSQLNVLDVNRHPFGFVLREHESQDAGFMQLFISEQYADLSSIEQNTGFSLIQFKDEGRGELVQNDAGGRRRPDTGDMWDTSLTVINVFRD